MTKQMETIEDVAQVLEDGGPFAPDIQFKTVREVVDALINLGDTPEVYSKHDDHRGLKSKLSDAFLNSLLEEANKPEFESEISDVVEQANIIIPLSERELTEEDEIEIEEDQMLRGVRDSDD